MNTPKLENLKLKNKIIERTPIKRIGLPADLGEAALFFARDGTEFTTGTMLFVDGGWMVSSHLL
jgi:NAD(P)-dependent dehydrogenase (short-subunit alcohol dehydrogenase family)